MRGSRGGVGGGMVGWVGVFQGIGRDAERGWRTASGGTQQRLQRGEMMNANMHLYKQLLTINNNNRGINNKKQSWYWYMHPFCRLVMQTSLQTDVLRKETWYQPNMAHRKKKYRHLEDKIDKRNVILFNIGWMEWILWKDSPGFWVSVSTFCSTDSFNFLKFSLNALP